MKKMYCPECGEEIVFTYETPAKVFRIDDGFVRDDNNTMIDDMPYLNFHCSADKEHDIDTVEITRWSGEVEIAFYDCEAYDL